MDCRYRIRNSGDLFSSLIMGLPLPTLIFSELITMTVTVTDPDFNLVRIRLEIISLQTVLPAAFLCLLN